MSNRVLLFAAAAFMAASSAGIVSTAMAAPRHANLHGICTDVGLQRGETEFSDCVRSLRQSARTDSWSPQAAADPAVPNASRFMAYAGPGAGLTTSPRDYFTSDHRAREVQACSDLGLHSGALRQCAANFGAATFQDELASHG